MHRSVALAVPLLLAAAVVPASAAPASASRVAAVRFAVPTAAGDRLDVELRATAHGSSDSISVSVMRCAATCVQPRVFAGALPVGALVIDGQRATATLDAALGGTGVRVRWSPDTGTGLVAGGLRGGGSGADTGVTTYRGDPATTTVSLGDGACHGTGSVGDEVDVATSDAGDTTVEPLSRLRLRDLGAPTCGG